MDLANVRHREERHLLARQHVVGVVLGNKYVQGEDTGDRAITVPVDAKLPEELLTGEDRVPREIGGTVTDVREVGVLMAGAPSPPPAGGDGPADHPPGDRPVPPGDAGRLR